MINNESIELIYTVFIERKDANVSIKNLNQLLYVELTSFEFDELLDPLKVNLQI